MYKVLIIIVISFLSCKGQPEQESIHKTFFPDQIWEQGEYSPIEDLILHIDTDDIKDTIRIYNITEWNDPGDYQKLEIKLSNADLFEIYNLGDWMNLDESHEKFKMANNYSTNRFLISKLSNQVTVLIIFGWTYASSPGNLTVINISDGNIKILYHKQFELLKIEDTNNDGLKELIGLPYYRQPPVYRDSISLGIGYCPIHVLNVNNDTLISDLILSENYNHENKTGFFGFDYDPDYRYEMIIPANDFQFKPYFHFEKYRKYPQSSLRFYSKKELNKYSKSELRIIRNEIFAFHGYKFKSADLNEYFSSQDWYLPSDYDVNLRLNKFEKSNIKLIKELEKVK